MLRPVVTTLVLTLLTACNAPSTPVARPVDPSVNRAIDAVWARDVARVARTGDWILSRSYSTAGDVIVATTSGEELSHASMYDAERGTIIEAISPVVREVPLSSLLARNRYVMVVRPAGLDERARLASVARARAMVGTAFDYTGVVGLDAGDRFYCSELVAWASRIQVRAAVVTPAELVDHGEVVYFSGARDDRATQRAALAAADLHARRQLAASLRTASR